MSTTLPPPQLIDAVEPAEIPRAAPACPPVSALDRARMLGASRVTGSAVAPLASRGLRASTRPMLQRNASRGLLVPRAPVAPPTTDDDPVLP